MTMTEADICREYRQSANPRTQISILADSNATTRRKIISVLERNGVVLHQKPAKANRNWDKDKAKALYDQGKTNREIAEAVGVVPNTINVWRRRLQLPLNRRRRIREIPMGKPVLDRNEIWFLRERPPTSPDALTALALEANKRKISYGQLVANTSGFERFEIVEAYKRECKERRTGRNENRPG